MRSEDDNRLSEERLLSDHDADLFKPHISRHTWRDSTKFWTIQVICFTISFSLFLGAVYYHRSSQPCNCTDYMPMYSPALEALEGTNHLQRFDGSFAKGNAFKGTPNPDIDAAWESITYQNGGVISISEETVHAINASASYSVKLHPEIGGGYMASVEALHLLHCLNMLRQATYEDYYKDKPGPWEDSPQVLRFHLDHCIDILRQKLMCDADAGILTYVWVKDHEMPFPDFNVQHKCRDFDALKDWVVERQIFTTKEHGIERMPGYQELAAPP